MDLPMLQSSGHLSLLYLSMETLLKDIVAAYVNDQLKPDDPSFKKSNTGK